MKIKLLSLAILGVFSVQANAATFAINNVVVGPGDTLYANSSNTLLGGSIVTFGTFTDGFDVNASLLNYPLLVSNFDPFTSGLTGNFSDSLGGAFAGYAEYGPFDNGIITGLNPLLGKTLYSLIGNFATLAGSEELALLSFGPIKDDVPFSYNYSANPGEVTAVLIGKPSVFVGDAGGGTGTYLTIQTVPVPEPSAALLGALGALGLLRRRRN
jgi:hypothetical protein